MSDAPIPTVSFTELTQDEKAYAGLAHALMMSTGFIGPLIVYLKNKRSRFVRFHASQALFWGVISTLFYFPTAFVSTPVFWSLNIVDFTISLALGIPFCLKAMRGEWVSYPLIGRSARAIIGD
ncbi:MAG: DUF4870 domain-containing protein [Candidatus Acidiferrales bacterium]